MPPINAQSSVTFIELTCLRSALRSRAIARKLPSWATDRLPTNLSSRHGLSRHSILLSNKRETRFTSRDLSDLSERQISNSQNAMQTISVSCEPSQKHHNI